MKLMQETIEQKVQAFLSATVAGRHSHLIAAYSGGPDSSVLLYLLKQFQMEFSYSLSAAYVNHNIRPPHEMLPELCSVKDWAGLLGVPLHIKEYPPCFIDYYAKKIGIGPEGAGRNCRYHFFHKLLVSHSSSALALGHNQDDQVETLLMRIFQGTGTEGLRGIPRVENPIIRPLLDITREEILEYAALKEIPYSIDSTNLTEDYRRNKIRHDLVPVLRTIFPKPEAALLRFADEIYRLGQSYTKDIEWESYREGFRLKEDVFFSLPLAVRKSLVLKKMNDLNKGLLPRGTRIPGRFFKPLGEGNERGNDRILLKGYHILMEKRGGWIFLQKDKMALSGGMFHFLDQENPFRTDHFSLSLAGGDGADETYSIPVLHYLCIRKSGGDRYRVCDGNETVLELDERGKIVYFLYEKTKISQNHRLKEPDCVIIKLEVNYAPG